MKIELEAKCPKCKGVRPVKKSGGGYVTKEHRLYSSSISVRGDKCDGGPVSTDEVVAYAKAAEADALRRCAGTDDERAREKERYEKALAELDVKEREARELARARVGLREVHREGVQTVSFTHEPRAISPLTAAETEFANLTDRDFATFILKFADELGDQPAFSPVRAMLNIAAERCQRASRSRLNDDDRKRAREQLLAQVAKSREERASAEARIAELEAEKRRLLAELMLGTRGR